MIKKNAEEKERRIKEKERQMKKERDKAAFYTGIKHLIHKRKSKKTK